MGTPLPPTTRFGTIVLAGPPNVGKSTLLNALVGESLGIVSPKAQTTQRPVIGIRTDKAVQLAFVDPPGFLDGTSPIHAAMRALAHAALRGASAVLHICPLLDLPAPPLATLLRDARMPPPEATALVLTQADRVPAPERPPAPAGAFVTSGRTGEGIPALLAWCRARATEAPWRYPAGDLSAQPLRFFVEEFVREAAFERLEDEVPYALAIEVTEFREGSDPVYIRVALYVERASQKRIVVGAGGRTLRAIGTAARGRIETLLGCHVYLDLWVKVLPKWRSDPGALRRFGFPTPTPRPE